MGKGRTRGGYVGVGEFEVCYERGFLNRFGLVIVLVRVGLTYDEFHSIIHENHTIYFT